MSRQDVALIRNLYEAFAKGDVPAVLAAMSPDIVWNEAENYPYADGNPYRGPEAILAGVFARIGSEWDGFAAVPEEYIDGGDTIVVLGRYRGTYRASGRSMDAQMVHVWRLADGRITRFDQRVDTLQSARVMTAA